MLFLFWTGAGTKDPIERTKADQTGQKEYSGQNQQNDRPGAINHIGEEQNGDRGSDDQSDDPIKCTHVLFHFFSFILQYYIYTTHLSNGFI